MSRVQDAHAVYQSLQLGERISIRDAGFRMSNQRQDCHSKKRESTLREIMGALGKLETFIRNNEMDGKTTSRFTLDYFPRNRAWRDESWKGSWRMWLLSEHKRNRWCARKPTISATMKRRSAAELESGIGGEMVRTKETNAADPDEQKAAQGTAVEGMSPIDTTAEEEVMQGLREIVSTLLEDALLGNLNCARLLMDRPGKAGQVRASEKEMPGISLADAWSAEPDWVGESSEGQAETAAGSREPEE
jgi:hypothetical protein